MALPPRIRIKGGFTSNLFVDDVHVAPAFYYEVSYISLFTRIQFALLIDQERKKRRRRMKREVERGEGKEKIQSPVMEHTRLGYLAAPVTKSGDITTIVLTISRNTCDRLSQDVLRPSGLTSISNYCPPYVVHEVKICWRNMGKGNRVELQNGFI